MEDPREAGLRQLNVMIAEEIRDKLPPGAGFTLLLYHFGEGGYMTYSSNANRGDMLKALEEFLENFRRDQ